MIFFGRNLQCPHSLEITEVRLGLHTEPLALERFWVKVEVAAEVDAASYQTDQKRQGRE